MSKASPDKKSATAIASKPIVPAVIGLGTDWVEGGITTSFDLLQEARAGAKSVADATIHYADTLTRSALDMARAVSTRLDALAMSGLEQSKVTALGLVSAARNTGNRVLGVAAGTAEELVGEREVQAA